MKEAIRGALVLFISAFDVIIALAVLFSLSKQLNTFKNAGFKIGQKYAGAPAQTGLRNLQARGDASKFLGNSRFRVVRGLWRGATDPTPGGERRAAARAAARNKQIMEEREALNKSRMGRLTADGAGSWWVGQGIDDTSAAQTTVLTRTLRSRNGDNLKDLPAKLVEQLADHRDAGVRSLYTRIQSEVQTNDSLRRTLSQEQLDAWATAPTTAVYAPGTEPQQRPFSSLRQRFRRRGGGFGN